MVNSISIADILWNPQVLGLCKVFYKVIYYCVNSLYHSQPVGCFTDYLEKLSLKYYLCVCVCVCVCGKMPVMNTELSYEYANLSMNNILAMSIQGSLVPRLPCSRTQTLKMCRHGEPVIFWFYDSVIEKIFWKAQQLSLTRKCKTLWGRAWASWYRNIYVTDELMSAVTSSKFKLTRGPLTI